MKKREIVTSPEILQTISKQIHTNEWDKTFGILEASFDVGKMSGLSAIQVGLKKHAFIVFLSSFATVRKFANARIIEQSAGASGTETGEEACLSIPDKKFKVERYKTIVVEDDLHGRTRYSGREARIIQHEVDHCNGITINMIGEPIK